MNPNEALNTLIEGVKQAHSKGAFTFEEAGILYAAAQVFYPPQAQAESEEKPKTVDDLPGSPPDIDLEKTHKEVVEKPDERPGTPIPGTPISNPVPPTN